MALGINSSSRWTRIVLAAVGLLAVLWLLAAPRFSQSDEPVLVELSEIKAAFPEACDHEQWAKTAMAMHLPLGFNTVTGQMEYATEDDLLQVERLIGERDALRLELSLTDGERRRLWFRWWDDSYELVVRPWYCPNY